MPQEANLLGWSLLDGYVFAGFCFPTLSTLRYEGQVERARWCGDVKRYLMSFGEATRRGPIREPTAGWGEL